MCAAMDTEFRMFPVSVPNSGEVFVSLSDTVFGFWEDLRDPSENSSNSGDLFGEDDDILCSVENNHKAFWEEQYHLLQV